MPIPGHQELMRPLLELLRDGAEHSIRDAYVQLADRFGLSEAEREELIPSGTQQLLHNRVGWAKTYLLKAGLLQSPRRAVVQITDRGRQALASAQQIDNRFLRQFPEFIEFVTSSQPTQQEGQQPQQVPVAPTSETTPEELIESGYRQVQSALASDVLERVKTATPAFFERLVVQLLVAMGYGGSMEDAGKAIGRSGDEGIDGIIKEDRLGLDVIYLQAKRWERTIGRPDIQQFAGALQGQRARKGVFITTSAFSNEARDYAGRIDTRIILIDGTELARLMITYGVGVTPVAVYELKRVDSDFFSEE
jgi:restriction system protein